MKEVCISLALALQGIVGKRVGSRVIPVSSYHCSDTFSALLSPSLAALSVSTYYRDWKDIRSTRLQCGKVWLRYSCGIVVIWLKTSQADKGKYVHNLLTHSQTHRHNLKPQIKASKFSTAIKLLLLLQNKTPSINNSSHNMCVFGE